MDDTDKSPHKALDRIERAVAALHEALRARKFSAPSELAEKQFVDRFAAVLANGRTGSFVADDEA